MTSTRTLRRRLRAWERYVRRYLDSAEPPGLKRALDALLTAQFRRSAFGGWFSDGHDSRCCLLGEENHPGLCVYECTACQGTARCVDCCGWGDAGCDRCGGTGECPDMCDAGRVVAL